MQNGLIDQYRIWVHPLVLGSGERLLKDGIKRADLSLVDTKPLSSLVVILIYQPGR
jgi:dihydrofolate reductase